MADLVTLWLQDGRIVHINPDWIVSVETVAPQSEVTQRVWTRLRLHYAAGVLTYETDEPADALAYRIRNRHRHQSRLPADRLPVEPPPPSDIGGVGIKFG